MEQPLPRTASYIEFLASLLLLVIVLFEGLSMIRCFGLLDSNFMQSLSIACNDLQPDGFQQLCLKLNASLIAKLMHFTVVFEDLFMTV